MRSAFEAWAQRDGHIVRRREDKPDEYLVFETQRRWVIWQAALAHGKTAAATTKIAAQKAAAAAGQLIDSISTATHRHRRSFTYQAPPNSAAPRRHFQLPSTCETVQKTKQRQKGWAAPDAGIGIDSLRRSVENAQPVRAS